MKQIVRHNGLYIYSPKPPKPKQTYICTYVTVIINFWLVCILTRLYIYYQLVYMQPETFLPEEYMDKETYMDINWLVYNTN